MWIQMISRNFWRNLSWSINWLWLQIYCKLVRYWSFFFPRYWSSVYCKLVRFCNIVDEEFDESRFWVFFVERRLKMKEWHLRESGNERFPSLGRTSGTDTVSLVSFGEGAHCSSVKEDSGLSKCWFRFRWRIEPKKIVVYRLCCEYLWYCCCPCWRSWSRVKVSKLICGWRCPRYLQSWIRTKSFVVKLWLNV